MRCAIYASIGAILSLSALAQSAYAQTPVQLLHPSVAASDNFGFTVANDGDTVIVGAPYDNVGSHADQGSALVYRRSGTGWSLEATLTASDGAADDQFGWSVALSGDTAVVGATTDDVGANNEQGSIYVFTRFGTTWTQQAKLTASDGAAHDWFGWRVAISNDTIIAGLPNDTVGANFDQGSAYVFTRSGTTWTQQANLTASDGARNYKFGYSVAISGDTAVIGAASDTVGANHDQGSVYVFTRSGSAWTQQAKLTAPDGSINDYLGSAVAISGDTVLVGAYADNIDANNDQGSVYVFARSGTNWTQQAKLTAADGAASDWFGYSVAISGDTAVIGASHDDVGANVDQGSAYVFTRSGIAWKQQAWLTAPDGAGGDAFGFRVGISGETAVVGVPYDDVAHRDQGSAWVFSLAGCRADFNDDGFVTGEDFDQFVQVFEAGDMRSDFNGDGFITGEDFNDFVQTFEAGC